MLWPMPLPVGEIACPEFIEGSISLPYEEPDSTNPRKGEKGVRTEWHLVKGF